MESIVTFSKKDFLQSLNTLKLGAKGANPPELVISYEDGCFQMRLGGIIGKIPCQGSFTGLTRLPGKTVNILGFNLPDKETLTIQCDDSSICFEGFRLKCQWESASLVNITIPVNATWVDALRLLSSYSEKAIEKAGLLDLWKAAQEKKEDRITKALVALSELGTTKEEINSIVDKHI